MVYLTRRRFLRSAGVAASAIWAGRAVLSPRPTFAQNSVTPDSIIAYLKDVEARRPAHPKIAPALLRSLRAGVGVDSSTGNANNGNGPIRIPADPTDSADPAQTQAWMIGSQVMSIAAGTPAEIAGAVLQAWSIAHTEADVGTGRSTTQIPVTDKWYDMFFASLEKLGIIFPGPTWINVPDIGGTSVDVAASIISAATTMLAPGAGTLAIITGVVNGMKGLEKSDSSGSTSSWVKLWDYHTTGPKTVALCGFPCIFKQGDTFLVQFLSFSLTSSETIGQVLFFKWRQYHASFKAVSSGTPIIPAFLSPRVLPQLRQTARVIITDQSFVRLVMNL